MFSSRLTWNVATNRLSKAVDAKRASGIRLLDLTESNPTRAGFDYPRASILNALAPASALCYQPDPRGILSARQAIADYYAARGNPVMAEALHLTASTSEAYAYLFKLLADPGDEVLVPQPSYPLFEFLAALESVRIEPYPLNYDAAAGWQINMGGLANTISTRTRAVIVVNPNNPTGSFLKTHELQQLNGLCAEHGLALIADEVFSDYAFGENAQRVTSLTENRAALTFVLSGLSKISALPQMKLGWIHVSGPEGLVADAQAHLDLIADTYLSVGTPVQLALPELLASRSSLQPQIMGRVTGNLEYLRGQCEAAGGCGVLRLEGGWYAVLEILPKIKEEEFALALLEEGDVFIHPGYFFDFPRQGFLVVSLLTSPEVFREGIARLMEKVGRGER